MKIAVINLTGGGLSGGYRKYILNVLPLLAEHEKISSVISFSPLTTRDIFKDLTGIDAEFWPINRDKDRLKWTMQKVVKFAPDIVFIPTSNFVTLHGIPLVTMVRNMEPLETPFANNPHLEKLRNLGRIYATMRSCMKAARVIAVSKHVERELIQRWRIPENKIGVVYHGIELTKEVRKKKHREDFIFTAGSIRPARGLEDLIEALGKMKNFGASKLVIGGSVDPGMEGYRSRLITIAKRNGISDRIEWKGRLTREEMSEKYKKCRVFVMTSRAEACPNTALEAMSHGCLVVSGIKQPMVEFFQDSALYYANGDAQQLAARMDVALNMSDTRRSIFESRARKRAEQFNWQHTVDRTVEELEIAIGR